MKKIKDALRVASASRLLRRVLVVAAMASLAGLTQCVVAGVIGVLIASLIAGCTEILVHAVDKEDDHV